MFLFPPQGQIAPSYAYFGLVNTVTIWPPQALSNRITGYLIASTPTAIGKGAMSGMQSIGDVGSGLLNLNQYDYIYNTAGIAAGFVTSGPNLVSTFAKNPNISIKHSLATTSNTRLYIGWSSANPLPVSDIPLALADQGIIVGFRSTDANYSVFSNDGSGVVVTDLGLPKDTAIHTVSITVSNKGARVVCSVDNTSAILTTHIPSANTSLNLFIQSESV